MTPKKLTAQVVGVLTGVLAVMSVQAQQTIPFRLQDNLIRVDTFIGGKSFTGVLDSGAGYVGLSPATGAALALSDAGTALAVAQAGKSTVSAQPVTIPSLTVGSVELRDTDGVVLDMSNLSQSAGFEIDALLGRSIFEQQTVRVDYGKRMISFLSFDTKTSCRNPIPFELRAGVPVVSVILHHGGDAEENVHLVVDLGTRHFAMMLASHVVETPIGRTLSAQGHVEQVGTGTGGPLMGVAAQLSEFSIGQSTFKNTRISLSPDLHLSPEIADGTLGVPLWEKGIVTFNYRDKKVCIDTF